MDALFKNCGLNNCAHVSVYTGCSDTYSRMFKAKTGECKRVFKGHTKAVVEIEVRFVNIQVIHYSRSKTSFDTLRQNEILGSNRIESIRFLHCYQ